MAEYVLSKRYVNQAGLDLNSTDLTRPIQFASDMNNAQYRKNGSVEKRHGYQGYAPSDAGYGMFTYSRVNPTSGLEEPECIAVSTKLNKLLETTLTVAYSGIDAVALISIYFDPTDSEFKCQVDEGSTNLLTQGLGVGFDEASIYTVTNLASAINALTGFTATVTGDGSVPAAFLPVVRTHDLVSADADFVTKYWAEVNCPVTSPFAGSGSNANDVDFENASFQQLNNVVYIGNGYDYIQKYDGQNVYRAGLPDPSTPTSALGGAGAITGNNYYHVAQYIQWDAAGNLVEGNWDVTATGVSPAAQSINVTVSNVQASNPLHAGYNTNCAIVAGAQVTVNTITVDDGAGGSHTMKVGDTAYFYDAVSSDYVEREVTAIAATTITVDGAAVTVADNAVISNNLRIGIFRNFTSAVTPTVFYLVAEIPNNSFAANQVYNDNLTDAQLGGQFIEPITDRSAPPAGKYVSAFRNQLVIAGNIQTPNTLYWSDVEGPEYFPNTGSNQADIQGPSGSIIYGIAPNNEVFVIFQKPGIHVLSGDISTGNIRIDQITSDIGCVAHATIQDVRGSLFFLSENGPRFMLGGQLPQPVGVAGDDIYARSSRIDSAFDTSTVDQNQWLVPKRSIAINHKSEEKYLLFIPCETTSLGGDVYSNSYSVIYAYDYTKDAWMKWTNMDLTGGACVFEDQLLWVERRYSEYLTDIAHILYRQMNLNDSWDYQDHANPIEFSYTSQWESLNEPSILKRFLAIRIFSLDETLFNGLMVNVTTEINYIPGATHTDFDIDFNISGYGASPWSTSAWGDTTEGARKHKLLGGRTRSLRVIFSNSNDQENSIITGWELEIAVANRAVIKS